MKSTDLDQFIEAVAKSPNTKPASYYIDKNYRNTQLAGPQPGKPTAPPQRQTVGVTTFKADQYYSGFPSNNLLEFLQWVAERLAEVPADHRADAAIDFEAYDSYGEPALRVEINYERPESDKELRERLEREERNTRELAERDRQTYLRLKARFEQ